MRRRHSATSLQCGNRVDNSQRPERISSSLHASARRSFELAREKGCRTVAVPAIGAGIGGFPVQRCAEILLGEAREHLAGDTSIAEIRFVLFGEPTYRIFEEAHDAAKIREQMEKLRSR